ncbi:PC3-like endoprotease variant B [Patiria miniata]|uniref:P/Homo B domain-containing protein n=1 Tax=Patiria miniata TaxID=46514 RepID=A0A914A6Y3_PATMI|nr:PC3-like endoprotease variant B [Patiria miniata]
MALRFLSFVLLALTGLLCGAAVTDDREDRMFHNEWAVEVRGGERVAREVADEYGFTFVRKIGTLENMYRLEKDNHHRRSRREAVDVTSLLKEDARVSWVEQQETHYHEKRDTVAVAHDRTGDDYVPPFNDPRFPDQWYLHNDGQNDATPGVDMNLAPVWKLGIMGQGVVVSVVDDGVDGTHPDLKANYDPDASWDFNGNDSNPHPDDRIEKGGKNNHGTRCAGEIAAEADNGICGVGAAPKAGIGGIRFLDGDVTDSMEADALTYANQHIDIYSCCWGPSDNGKTMREPGKLMTEALAQGCREGRGGKGSIYMWASGNGGHNDDDCGADAYVGNIHTISVGSINDKGESVYFMESCPSTMGVILSGGMNDRSTKSEMMKRQNLVITTDIHDKCIDTFIGTSSAAPLGAGLMALVLQANPNLTWRDVQHVVVNGANIPNTVESGWHVNGAGFHVNEMFGFGMLDAGKMVELALTWQNVGEQRICEEPVHEINKSVLQGMAHSVHLRVNCPQITKLEHVKVRISFQARRRGDVSLTLSSPFGTPSELLSRRRNDNSSDEVKNFPFMSVRNWGENPTGTWVFELMHHFTPAGVQPKPKWPDIPRQHDNVVDLKDIQLILYGTGDDDRSPNTNAVSTEHTGKLDSEDVVDIFNDEQKANEEIVVDLDDLADGVKPPPNTAHNLDKHDKDVINTGQFDQVLQDPEIRSLIHEMYVHKKAEALRKLAAKRLQKDKRYQSQWQRSHDRSHDLEESSREALEEVLEVLHDVGKQDD